MRSAMSEEAHGEAIDQACERFEKAWDRGDSPELRDFFLPVNHASYWSVLTALVETDIEYRLKKGAQALKVEEYVSEFSIVDEAAVAELAIAEYRCEQQWGDQPDIYQYTERFPRLRERLLPPLREAARDVCPTVIGVYANRVRIYSWRLGLPLEIGRQQDNEPAPICVLGRDDRDRLIAANSEEENVSAVHCTIEAVAKNRNRITNHSQQLLQMELAEPLMVGEHRVVEQPSIIKVGHVAIRVADR